MVYEYCVNTYDENFDFFESQLPENTFLFAFGDQLNRTRELLNNRTHEEIEYLIESLNWMLEEGSKSLSEEIKPEIEQNGFAFHDRVKALKSYKDFFDISDQPSVPNVTWTDYFSVLSLVTILEALKVENFEQSFSNFSFPMEAMEAVCLAESFQVLDDYDKKLNQKRGQIGGRKSTSKFNEITNKALKIYRDTPGLSELSNRRAAFLIAENYLKEELEETLNTEEPELRIAIWIGKYKQGKLTIS